MRLSCGNYRGPSASDLGPWEENELAFGWTRVATGVAASGPAVVEDGAAADRVRDGAFVAARGGHIGNGLSRLFDASREGVEPLEAVQFVGAPHLRGVERAAQDANRLVVHRERHRKRMPVLAAVREREARGIG